MSDRPLVSVIVPIFNVEKYLKRCVDSIINQTYTNLQIILVDDGSTDDCSYLCDEYKSCDSRVSVIHKTNGGLSDARNAGLNIAKGEYLAFIDSDDFISENAIEEMIIMAINNNCEIAISNMIRFYDNGEKEPFYKPTDKVIVLDKNNRFDTLNQPSVCNKLFSAKLFKNIRFPKGKFYEDTFVYHELLFKANRVVLTGCDGYWYYLRKNSILGNQKLTNKYFDFIQAVYNRTIFLYENKIYKFAYDAFLSYYAALSNAYNNIEKTNENKNKFKKSFDMYNILLKKIESDKIYKISMKQRLRLYLLKYLPNLHKRIY